MKPQTVLGRRRLAILKRLAASKSDSTVPALAAGTGFCSITVRHHLKALEVLGLVTRTNFRRWRLADGITLGGLDGSRLDPQEDPHAAHR